MKRLVNLMQRLHRSEQGAEGLEKLLIIAAVVLPLLGVLIFARDWIKEWVGTDASDIKSDSENFDPTF
jgi:Flp pilus assembly pilin Flp